MPKAALLVAVVLFASPAVAQERVAGELRAGGGYDSNPALAADPGSRRAVGRGPMRPSPSSPEDGFMHLNGWVTGRIGRSPQAMARLDVEGRVNASGALFFWERLQIEGAFREGDLVPRCRIDGARLDTTASDDSAWSGRLACGASLQLPHGFWTDAELGAGLRTFDVGQLDGFFGGEISAGVSFEDLFAVELGLGVMRRESDEKDARRTELAPWVGVRVTTQYAGGRAAYRYIAREVDVDAQSGAEHVGRVEAWGMPLPWIGAYVGLEFGYAAGGPQALAYERVQVTAGLRLALEWSSPEAERKRERKQGPATLLEGGWVCFSFDLPEATAVSVVGDFNGWDPQRGRLERRADGRFEGRLRLGPGRHAYSLIVDGEPTRPPGAARYVPDGFGGENAIVDVGEAP